MKRIIALAMAIAFLLAACSRPAPKAEEEPSTGEKPAESSGPTAPAPDPKGPSGDPETLSLMPAPDRTYVYVVSDEEKPVTETYIRDGERLIGTYNGKVYVTWVVNGQGIWRQDPKGTALLRYLPPDLKPDLAWTQPSGDRTVWFRLRKSSCEPGNMDRAKVCWELTMLNGAERATFLFAQGEGIVYAASENLARPEASYVKRRSWEPPQEAPGPVAVPTEPASPPSGAPAPVTEVSLAEFAATETALLREHGALLEIDLDGDGKAERVEGRLGVWHAGPLALYDASGQKIRAFYEIQGGTRHKVVIETVPGLDRPVLLYQAGHPDRVHTINPRWLEDGQVFEAWGWAPKTSLVWGGAIRVEKDGLFTVTGTPSEMAGYDWTRRYRVTRGDGSFSRYEAKLVEDRMTPGPYPTTPDDLVTAAFLARWWGLKEELARYIPDEGVRQGFLAVAVKKPPYYPSPAKLGKVSFETPKDGADPIPKLEPAPLAADQSTDFLIWVGQYEGADYYAGRVTFARADDGRLIISRIEIKQTGFVY
jgi:hypothetical protein